MGTLHSQCISLTYYDSRSPSSSHRMTKSCCGKAAILPRVVTDLATVLDASDASHLEGDEEIDECEDDEHIINEKAIPDDHLSLDRETTRRQAAVGHSTHKLLQDQTASNILGATTTPHATFLCPVCGDVFDPSFRLYPFYRHLDDPIHLEYLSSRCLICQIHHNSSNCPSTLERAVQVSYKCLTRATETYTIYRLRDLTPSIFIYWTKYHSKQSYMKPNHLRYIMCRLGFCQRDHSSRIYISHTVTARRRRSHTRKQSICKSVTSCST